MENEQKTQNNSKQLPDLDFSSTYTANFPKILKALNISLAVTSYQSSRLILIRTENDKIDTRLKIFPRPMGIYADKNRITLGTLNQVIEFKRSDSLLKDIKKGALDNINKYSKKVLEKNNEELKQLQNERDEELKEIKRSDSLYLHRAGLTTGMINIHDIAWGEEGLWVVNSTFSCLCTLNPQSSFVSRWRPDFISELAPEDRCHLNGMAMVEGKPKYVTTFNQENTRDSWNKRRIDNGTLIDVDTKEKLIEEMIMPHSPKYYNGSIYVCESGIGIVWKIDPKTKEKTEVIKLQGYPRGLKFYGDIMFVCTSKLRENSVKPPIPLVEEFDETYAGIWIIDTQTHEVLANITFTGDVDQLYDIAVIPESTVPEMVNINSSLTRHLFYYQEEEI